VRILRQKSSSCRARKGIFECPCCKRGREREFGYDYKIVSLYRLSPFYTGPVLYLQPKLFNSLILAKIKSKPSCWTDSYKLLRKGL